MNVKEKAINLLSRREHSQKELIRKLTQKGYLPSEIDNLCEFLLKHDLQSDERFTESYVRSRMLAGFGPKRIYQELLDRGVANSLADKYINENSDVWYEQIAHIWHKRFFNNNYSGYTQADKIRWYRFLLYRGFNPEMISRWLKEVSAKGKNKC